MLDVSEVFRNMTDELRENENGHLATLSTS
jgi:hypothetical protein